MTPGPCPVILIRGHIVDIILLAFLPDPDQFQNTF